MDKLLEVLREKKYDKKPNVDTLKAIDGLGDVNANQRDEAWAVYQKELEEQAAASSDDAESNDSPSDESDSEKDTTTTTSTTNDDEQLVARIGATHRVTVKRDGFRRLGRAWMGSTEVALTEDEVNVLEADPMFVVVEL